MSTATELEKQVQELEEALRESPLNLLGWAKLGKLREAWGEALNKEQEEALR